MLFSLLYMVVRAVLRLAPAGDQRDREVEILVLRHQVKVLKRKAGRPRLRRRDREGCVYPDSRCCSVIRVNQPAESIDADDFTVTPTPGGSQLRRLQRKATVRSFLVVEPESCLDRATAVARRARRADP